MSLKRNQPPDSLAFTAIFQRGTSHPRFCSKKVEKSQKIGRSSTVEKPDKSGDCRSWAARTAEKDREAEAVDRGEFRGEAE